MEKYSGPVSASDNETTISLEKFRVIIAPSVHTLHAGKMRNIIWQNAPKGWEQNGSCFSFVSSKEAEVVAAYNAALYAREKGQILVTELELEGGALINERLAYLERVLEQHNAALFTLSSRIAQIHEQLTNAANILTESATALEPQAQPL